MELSRERGASAWLTSLAIDDHGFTLHKSAFRDALSLSSMAGHYKIYHHTVHVAIYLVSNMHVTSQHLGSQRFVMEWQLSHISSCSQEKSCLTIQQLLITRARLDVAMYGFFLGGGGGGAILPLPLAGCQWSRKRRDLHYT